VVSIGRRFDNHIILDDSRVSRAHAQLRLRFGHYVVYDLSSTGGTFVNDKRVEECVLRPGDVISLGGVTMIYGEDTPQSPKRALRPPGAPGTRPMPPLPPSLPPNTTPDQ
jgi:pSer/pThr/pTyr-binding forkhead associated (FHA) protein